jgi:hypothetical protein
MLYWGLIYKPLLVIKYQYRLTLVNPLGVYGKLIKITLFCMCIKINKNPKSHSLGGFGKVKDTCIKFESNHNQACEWYHQLNQSIK